MNNHKQSGLTPTAIILIIAGVLVVAGGVLYYLVRTTRVGPGLPPSSSGCTQEAKQCPDGSYVARTGPNCEFAACPGEKSGILSELDNLNIVTMGQPTQQEIMLPSDLSGANWGLKKTVCEQGGYDLSSFAGKSVLLTSYSIEEKYKNEPLEVWIITSGETIVCVYKAVGENSQLTPGVFPVSKKKACTEEAKVCPDGTIISRTGPNCEFAACPQKGCVKAGQEIRPEDYQVGARCCQGLVEIVPQRFAYPCSSKSYTCNSGCSVPPPYAGPWVQCNQCGNKSCESNQGENRCNCPQDCQN